MYMYVLSFLNAVKREKTRYLKSRNKDGKEGQPYRVDSRVEFSQSRIQYLRLEC